MPIYSADHGVSLLKLPSNPEFEVQMKQHPSFGDYRRAVEAAYRRIPDRDASPGEWFSAHLEAAALALIIDWNLEDDQGAKWPITAESLAELKPQDGDFLLTEAGNRIRGRSQEDEIPFANGSGRSSKATTSRRRHS